MRGRNWRIASYWRYKGASSLGIFRQFFNQKVRPWRWLRLPCQIALFGAQLASQLYSCWAGGEKPDEYPNHGLMMILSGHGICICISFCICVLMNHMGVCICICIAICISIFIFICICISICICVLMNCSGGIFQSRSNDDLIRAGCLFTPPLSPQPVNPRPFWTHTTACSACHSRSSTFCTFYGVCTWFSGTCTT